MVDVAIIGHGVVGSGVAEIILNHKDLLTEKANASVVLISFAVNPPSATA